MSHPAQQAYEALPDDVRWALERADGYIDLRMYARAHETLDTLPEAHQGCLPYQLHLLRLLMAEESWEAARRLALDVRTALPGESFVWIQLAYATRRARTLSEAEAILLEALDAFPEDALIPYNLSCYACRQQELVQARDYLKQAIGLENSFRLMALEDEDLEPLWDDVERM